MSIVRTEPHASLALLCLFYGGTSQIPSTHLLFYSISQQLSKVWHQQRPHSYEISAVFLLWLFFIIGASLLVCGNVNYSIVIYRVLLTLSIVDDIQPAELSTPSSASITKCASLHVFGLIYTVGGTTSSRG